MPVTLVPYSTLEELGASFLRSKVLCGGDIKFVSPDNAGGWYDKLRECMFSMRALLTLHKRYPYEYRSFTLAIEHPFLYKATTFRMEYYTDSFAFVIKSGTVLPVKMRVGQYEQVIPMVLKPMQLFVKYEEFFDQLVISMRSSLPHNRAVEVIKRLDNEFGGKIT